MTIGDQFQQSNEISFTLTTQNVTCDVHYDNWCNLGQANQACPRCNFWFLIQRSIRGRAAEMGPKLASWYNDDPLLRAKTGIKMGHIFKIV